MVNKVVSGHILDGTDLSQQMFHLIMVSAALGKAEELQTLLPILMKDDNIGKIRWDYRPPKGAHQDKTLLWLLMFSVKKGEKWAQDLLSKLLTQDVVRSLDWNTASADGMTPFWWLMAGAMEQKQCEVNAVSTLLRHISFDRIDWNACAKTGPGVGRTPLYFLAQMSLNNVKNLALLERVRRDVAHLDYQAAAQAGDLKDITVDLLYARGLAHALDVADQQLPSAQEHQPFLVKAAQASAEPVTVDVNEKNEEKNEKKNSPPN